MDTNLDSTKLRLIQLIFLLLLLPLHQASSQSISWSPLADMPVAVSNNAVASATVDGQPYVFSFAGIGPAKDWYDIHLYAFRYDVQTNQWDSIPPLPDPQGGKIAAAASTVKNKIYIIGGYHVASNYNETSSNKVHIYNPETNAYEADGADIPIPIDDQVQAVWRDSLIYVISGWSNTTNVPNVQIYNPSTDSWMSGTPVPNSSSWKVFGGSGIIIGDTIYYAGGAESIGNFGPTAHFRKGAINPDNPAEITWMGEEHPDAKGYRMAAGAFEGQPFWLGGSANTYNFDGIAYDGSGGVAPWGRLLAYQPGDGQLTTYNNLIPPVMDLRGIAQISPNQFILAGGMLDNQMVSSQTMLITIDYLQGTLDSHTSTTTQLIRNNPANSWLELNEEGTFDITIYNNRGQEVLSLPAHTGRIDISHLPTGQYYLVLSKEGKLIGREGFMIIW